MKFARVLVHATFGVGALDKTVKQHLGDQERLPTTEFQNAKPEASGQAMGPAKGEAAIIVHAPVMHRQ